MQNFLTFFIFPLFIFHLQENVGGTTYFYPTAANHQLTPSSTVNTTENTFVHVASSQINLSYSHPGQWAFERFLFRKGPFHQLFISGHVYPGPASHVVNMQAKAQLSMAYFLQDELRNDILSRNEIVNSIETECQGTFSVDSHSNVQMTDCIRLQIYL